MKLLKYITIMPAVALALTSCSDDLSGSDWSEGAPSAAPGVYFDPANETYTALMDGDDAVVELNVKRIGNEGTLTVPVVVTSADPNILFPSTITFEDGKYETTMCIDFADAPAIVSLPIEVTFPEEFINPYAAGASSYSGTVIVSHWENVSPTGTTTFKVQSWSYKDENYLPVESEMTHLLGSNRYRIKNFVNTGVDFTFELVDSPLKDGYKRIVPVNNQLLLSDYGWGDYSYYNAWWLITDDFYSEDEDAEGWPDTYFYTPAGDPFIVYYIEFLWYDDGTKTEYCYVTNLDKGTPVAYMAFTGFADEDMEKYLSYYRLRFAWTENTDDGSDPTVAPSDR